MAKAPAPKTEETKSLVPVETNLPAVADASGYEEYSGQGFEGTSSEDFSIPFIAALQGLSPQCETVEGAKPGVIINTVTNDIYKGAEGVVIVPCATKHCFVEWKPRAQGGGFVAEHGLDADVVVHCKEKQEYGSYKTPAGNDLIETFYVYGVQVTEDGGIQVAIAFSSTKIKSYKAWMTKARAIQIAIRNAAGVVTKRITPPLFAHKYRLTTIKQKNSKGEYYNWTAAFDGTDAAACRIPPNSELFESCVAVANMVKEGSAKLNMSSTAPDGAEGGSAGAAAGADRTADDDAPF